jgi:class 3 adenylate cyclase/tetratricopeptide (TPR) repeat protein
VGSPCASCGAANAADARYCAQCGAPLDAARCEACGEALADGVRFCPNCGTAVGQAAPAAREARKVVTALFADVVGSTTLAERLDPEDFTSLVGEAVRRMAVAVEAFGGSVSELAGDGLLALFGAPAAHEDDPERAVLAGLRIVADIEGYAAEVARDWEIRDFGVRVGIETGLAVLGPLGGGDKIEYTAMGDSINTAARLQAASEAGMVLVGGHTQRLIAAAFSWGEARELQLKGKTGAVLAYPVAELEGSAAAAPDADRQSPLIGRDEELAAAAEAVDAVLHGSGGVLIVSGDAGIGKSRLAGELRRRFEAAGGAPGHWLTGRCVSYGESLPYWPFRALLRDWLRRDADIAGNVGDALRMRLQELVGERATDVEPLLAAMLGEAAGEADPSEELQRRIHDAATTVFAALAGEGPVVMCLDDVHWADASSLALVEHLLELCDEQPVLLVLCARAEREGAWWRTRERVLRELPHRVRELTLEALGEAVDAALLESLVGAGTLPEQLERRLLARAEGNPLYLEELVRSMIDGGALVPANGGWSFDRDVPVEVPETVEKVILARVDRLDSDAREVLAAAAVLGRQFTLDLLEAVASDPRVVRGALRTLQRADLVREGARWPEPVFRFRHSLIQEAAYGSLLRRHRQELHRRAAEGIEGLGGERADALVGMLALHWEAAGDDERALTAHRRAAEAAGRLFALEEAIEHWTGALEAAGRLGRPATDPDVLDARRWRGALRYARGELGAAREDLETGVAGARAAGDRPREVEILLDLAGVVRNEDWTRALALFDDAVRRAEALGDSAIRVNALARGCIAYCNQLRLTRAVDTGEGALALAEAGVGGREALVYALDALKLTAHQLGDLERLERLADRLLALVAESSEDLMVLQWTLLEAAYVPLGRGRWEEAATLLQRARDISRERGQTVHDAPFAAGLCWLHRSRGDYAEAVAVAREVAAAMHDVGAGEWAAWLDADLGWALLESGDRAGAVEVLARGGQTAEKVAAPNPRARCTSLLAWAHASRGDLDATRDALERAETALGVVEVPDGRAWLYGGHAYVAAGRARLALGDAAGAEALVAPLRAPAEDAGWREVDAAAALVAGLARAAAGDDAAAHEALGRARAVAEAAGLPYLAGEARAALARG